MQHVRKQRLGAVAGIAAPIVAFSCITISVASYSEFSWLNNALSDLGIISGITGPLFNFGVASSGFLAFLFAVLGLFTLLRQSWAGKVGSLVFAAATLALLLIGVFNESFSPTHFWVSVAFFVLAPIALFILVGGFVLAGRRSLAVFTLLVGLVAAVPWILEFTVAYVPNVAVPETVSGLAVSVWAIALGIRMLRKPC